MSRGGACVTQTEHECDDTDETKQYQPGSFGSVDYTLTPCVRADGLRQLGLTSDHMAIDLFASEANAQAPLFCTSENSAWRYSWTALCQQTDKWLWANPPFDHMHEVVQKLEREAVNMVILVPYWPRRAWYASLRRMATNSFFIHRTETRYKPKPGLPTPPQPKWDTVLFLVETLEKGRVVDEETTLGLWGLKELEKNARRHEPNPVVWLWEQSELKKCEQAREPPPTALPPSTTSTTPRTTTSPSPVQHVICASHSACALPAPLLTTPERSLSPKATLKTQERSLSPMQHVARASHSAYALPVPPSTTKTTSPAKSTLVPESRRVVMVSENACTPTKRTQLLMTLRVRGPNGKDTHLTALVDTGACVNLIKKGCLSDQMTTSADPLKMVTANGETLQGGDQEIDLELDFRLKNEEELPFDSDTFHLRGKFHDADIENELILGYPWLQENNLAILPAEEALACGIQNEMLLGGWEPPKTDSENSSVWKIRKMNLLIDEELSDMSDDEKDLEPQFLDEEEVLEIVQRLKNTDLVRVRTIVSSEGEWGEHQPLVEGLRKALHQDYPDVLADEIQPNPPVRGDKCEARIYLKEGANPRKMRLMQMNGERRDATEKITDDWLKADKIERCDGPWSASCFPVMRPGKPPRGVIDFRPMNEQCQEDSYPLPRIDDILVKQGQKHIHSALDLKDAFHQIPLRKEDRYITGTVTPRGLFQWKVVPMGWKNGVQYCQRNLEVALAGVREIASGYVDDILIGSDKKDIDGSSTKELLLKHDREIRLVLDELRKFKMVASRKKAQFFQRSVNFCGFALKDGKREPLQGRIVAVENWELPKTITSLRGFLGFANYYSAYIENFAEIVGPMQDKLKVDKNQGKKGSTVKIQWDAESVKSFDDTRGALCKALTLQNVRVDQPFVMRVDASGKAIGASLEQVPNGHEASTIDDMLKLKTVPVGFMSRKLTESQMRTWDIRDKECYAIISALEKWAGWIGLQPVVILTDHKALEHWATETLESTSGVSGRRARWHQKLSRFKVVVQYIQGKDNVVADALSRFAYPASQSFADVSWHGALRDLDEMRAIIAQEEKEEKASVPVKVLTRAQEKAQNQSLPPPPESALGTSPGYPVPITIDDFENYCLRFPEGSDCEIEEGVLGQREADLPPVEPPLVARGEKARAHTGPPREETPLTPEETSHSLRECTREEQAEPNRRIRFVLPEDPSSSNEELWTGALESGGLSPLATLPNFEEGGSEEPDRDLDPAFDFGAPYDIDAEISGDEVEVEEGPLFADVLPEGTNVWETSWAPWYLACPRFSEPWKATQTGRVWPEHYQLSQDGKTLFFKNRQCVPTPLIPYVVREHHEASGHTGSDKLKAELARFYEWDTDTARLNTLIRTIVKHCVKCQMFKPTYRDTRTKLRSTPIPNRLGCSVSMDIFQMEKKVFRGQTYDCFILVVDRLSGFILTEPTTLKNLTPLKVAELIWGKWVDIFGPPSVLTSDQDPRFTSHWWKSMCALFRTRIAFSHAYYHQGNGKAERTGKEVKEMLQRVCDEGENWVEMLPWVRYVYLDTPGPTGLSPYEIVYGRTRHEAGPPFEGVTAEAAETWFKKRQDTLTSVQTKLQALQEKQLEKLNAKRAAPPDYEVGDWVWYRHPPGKSNAPHPVYTGPWVLRRRIGDVSWVIWTGMRTFTGHVSSMKRFFGPIYGGRRVPLAFSRVAKESLQESGEREWVVEKILKHKTVSGELQFLTAWKGFPEEEASWEPLGSFIHRYSSDFVEYAKGHGLYDLPLLHHLTAHLSVAGGGARAGK